jgi:hypothetical protein
VRRLSLVVLACALFFMLGQLPASAWTVDVIDQNVADGFPSLAVSLSDHVWVAWDQGNALLWAKWTGSAWQTTQVADFSALGCDPTDAPSAGFDPTLGTARIASLCYGPDDTGKAEELLPHILYTYKSPSSGEWITRKLKHVPTAHCSGTYPALVANVSLAFDPETGDPGIAYADSATGHVYWLHQVGGRWSLETVAKGVGNRCDPYADARVTVAYDPAAGTPAIAWTSTRDPSVQYSSYDAGTRTWQTEEAGDAVSDGAGVSLAFTPSGTPWIALTEEVAGGNQALAVSTPHGPSWSVTTVDSVHNRVGQAPSIAMKGGLPRVASFDDSQGDLRWAAYSGTAWTVSTLDTVGSAGLFPSLGFSSVGDPYVAYRYYVNASTMGVKWARPSN